MELWYRVGRIALSACVGLACGCTADVSGSSGSDGSCGERPQPEASQTRANPRDTGAMAAHTRATDVASAPAAETAVSEPAPELHFDVCGQGMSQETMTRWLQGQLVLAATQHEHGLSAASAAIGFALELALNGIDFGALGSGRPEFHDGAYVFRNGDAAIGVRFVFAHDVGEWQAGTPITHDLLDPASFVTDVDLDVDVKLSLTDPDLSVDVRFEPGPLFALVDAEITWDGVLPSDFSVRLDSQAIAIQIVTVQDYQLRAPLDRDELTIVLETAPVPLFDLGAVLEGGGLSLDYSDTSYSSAYFGLDELFTEAVFSLHRRDDGRFGIEGPYTAVSSKAGLTLYHRGQVSTFEGNQVALYCDADGGVLAGTATHAADLRGGTFTTAAGDTFEYGLDALPDGSERLSE